MASKYENYIIGDDANTAFYDTLQHAAQTFTPSTSHIISSVFVKLLRFAGSVPGVVTCFIWATDGSDEPIAPTLTTGTISATIANAITTAGNGEWKEITLTAGYFLSAGTVYSIALKSSTNDTNKPIFWRRDTSAASYSGGKSYAADSPYTSWSTTGADDDFMFEQRVGVYHRRLYWHHHQ